MTNNIRTLIKRMATAETMPTAIICTVDAVDKEARTVDCTPIDEQAPIPGVNLQANQEGTTGWLAVPKVGSYVVVMMTSEATGVVVATDDVESVELNIGETTMKIADGEITLNGGSLGGLVKIEELTNRLNLIERDINKLKSAMSSAPVVAQDGGASFKGGMAQWYGTSLTETKRSDMENDKIKQ